MSGRELYEAYAAFHAERNNCSIDSWDDLPSYEQAAWEHIANLKR